MIPILNGKYHYRADYLPSDFKLSVGGSLAKIEKLKNKKPYRCQIENHSGIWYVNHKRLGHDKLSGLEIKALNNFIKDFKTNSYE